MQGVPARPETRQQRDHHPELTGGVQAAPQPARTPRGETPRSRQQPEGSTGRNDAPGMADPQSNLQGMRPRKL